MRPVPIGACGSVRSLLVWVRLRALREDMMRRFGVLVIGALTALAVAAPAALGTNIVYTKDRNVFVTPPDGSTQRQITTNGAVDNAYRSPTEKNDGTMVAPHSSKFFFLFNLD